MIDSMFHETHGDNDLFARAMEENPEMFSTTDTSKEHGRAFQATSITTVPVAFNWEDQKSC